MHLFPHISHAEMSGDSTLHVVGVIANPVRYQSRIRMARKWLDDMQCTRGVNTYLVESAFGDRQHELDHTPGRCLRVRTSSEIWTKENLINLGVARLLPRDWRYVAWVDCDVEFRDPNWATETLHALQHWEIIQPWQHCADLGPHGEIVHTHASFGYRYQQGQTPEGVPPYQFAHPGYAWACTRRFWERARGLLDHAILGSADHHMAYGCLGKIQSTLPSAQMGGYARLCEDWQRRAAIACAKQVGYVPGRIEHSWHGRKRDRHYQDRWQILVNHKYDPISDLYYDEQGVLQLADRPDLEQALKIYNRSRHEDSIDLE